VKRLLTLGVVLCAAALQPIFAQDNHFKLYGAAVWVSPLETEDVDIGDITDSLELAEDLGWNFGIEFRFNDWIGLEADYINVTNDVDFGGDTIGEVDLNPISATLNFHLAHTKVIDFYLGPTASWVLVDDIETDFGDIETDDEFAWGATVGLDIGLGDTVAIVTGLRWLNLDVEGDDLDAGVDPLIARLGLGFRW
jgi:hypothetical protein